MSNLGQLKKQLLSRIDTEDLLEVNKVERMIKLLDDMQKCDAEIKKEGISIIVENGSQRYIKSHPSLNDKVKINAQLISLEKTINFINEGTATTAETVEESEDDLI